MLRFLHAYFKLLNLFVILNMTKLSIICLLTGLTRFIVFSCKLDLKYAEMFIILIQLFSLKLLMLAYLLFVC